MTNNEKKRQYFRKYFQEHKEECRERYRRNYQRRKELGLVTGEIDLYHTIEELKQGEIEEFGAIGEAINWAKWTEVIEQTKQAILKALEDYKAPPKRKQIYCYSMTSKIPLIVFKNSDEAATTLGVNRMIITNHARLLTPLYDKGIILSYQPI